MAKKLRIVLAQLNLTVGDIQGNLQKHIKAAIEARDVHQADIIVFPELGLTGYPPEDLLLRKTFLDDAHAALQRFMLEVNNIHCVISHTHVTSNGLHNACSLIHNGIVLAKYAKQHLPNYGVFDEDRYFVPGNNSCVVPINGIPVGIVICEDLWFPGPTQQAAMHGARLILSPNASPFETNKHELRLEEIKKRIKQNHVPIVYVNNVGGQDDLIFDGGSMVLDEKGDVAHFAGFFNETLLPVEIEFHTSTTIAPKPFTLPTKVELVYQGLVLALRDYIEKNRFPGVLIGVSGGIDSALTLAIAVDALGKNRVRAIIMPSHHTASMSLEDASALAANFGVKADIISIEAAHQMFRETLSGHLSDNQHDITDQNIQARARAVILMALSNKTGYLVLPTGNRSELAVGYCTLYGDMAGGFSVLKDVPKTLVYELANYRNRVKPLIPERIIERAPTAELAPNQLDEDSLPPYPILDAILELYLNQQLGIEEICVQGFEKEVVTKVVELNPH